MLQIIAAYSVPGRILGYQGKIPWHYRDDMQHFKTLTNGHACIMGRKTWESLPKPLVNRRNIIVTKNKDYKAIGGEVCNSLGKAILEANKTDMSPFVIGGAELYKQALPIAKVLHLTEIDEYVAVGDTFFPEIDETLYDLEWFPLIQSNGTTLVFNTFTHRYL